MVEQVSHELEVNVPASHVWELYGTLRLTQWVHENQVSKVLEDYEVCEGDGGVGTVLKLTFVPGTTPYRVLKEKFTKVDDEKRVKEAEVIEGGLMDFGFSLYRVRFEVVEKSRDSSIIKSTIEYIVKEDDAANASLVSIQPLADLAFNVKTLLLSTITK